MKRVKKSRFRFYAKQRKPFNNLKQHFVYHYYLIKLRIKLDIVYYNAINNTIVLKTKTFLEVLFIADQFQTTIHWNLALPLFKAMFIYKSHRQHNVHRLLIDSSCVRAGSLVSCLHWSFVDAAYRALFALLARFNFLVRPNTDPTSTVW